MRKMGLVYDQIFLEHNTGSHPENAMRLKYILEALEDYQIRDKMTDIVPDEASLKQLSRFHPLRYIERVASFADRGGGYLDPDTVVSAKSYQAAVKAAGGVINAIDQVIAGDVESAFAFVRPPGHHALADRSMGFCLFNNVVIGAMHAKAERGLERILIVDWDVHHGNGTSDAFYNDPAVLYFSTHQQGNFPGTGRVSEVGGGAGEGFTINVPLTKGTGDTGFYYVFTQLLEPVARQYKPQLIIISAGFDAHHSDPLAGLALTCSGYAKMAEIVKNIAGDVCDGRVVLALEGGYNLGSIGHAAAAVINVFGEYGAVIDEPGRPPADFTQPTMRMPIDAAIETQKKYWKL
ncbi:MAG: histone deacetylase [Firmicutes bacterium HGW-Firmicutes-8]|nr:MAG: histone deacetylase [Firmicutes bacterium HGW-Firmicutes-8]